MVAFADDKATYTQKERGEKITAKTENLVFVSGSCFKSYS